MEFGNKTYSELSEDIQRDFLKYPISAVLLIDLDDNAIFDIFARLNTYSVKLNNQELLNSQFFGVYKRLVYSLAREYRPFWVESGILTEKGISRMDDAKLVSDLLAAIVKNKIESNSFEQSKKIYAQYDEEFVEAKEIEQNFIHTLDLFSKVYGQNFSETVFNKLPLFYSTFLALYHMNYPLSMFGKNNCIISEKDLPKIKTVLDDINMIISEEKELTKDEEVFVFTMKKNTTTPDVRMKRCMFIVNKLSESLR